MQDIWSIKISFLVLYAIKFHNHNHNNWLQVNLVHGSIIHIKVDLYTYIITHQTVHYCLHIIWQLIFLVWMNYCTQGDVSSIHKRFGSDLTGFPGGVGKLPCCFLHAIVSSVTCYLSNGNSIRNFFQILFGKFHSQGADIVIQVLNFGSS